jgi:hypothetical protein
MSERASTTHPAGDRTLVPSGIDFCDRAGRDALLRARRHARDEGRTVALRTASAAVHRMLPVTVPDDCRMRRPAQHPTPGRNPCPSAKRTRIRASNSFSCDGPCGHGP